MIVVCLANLLQFLLRPAMYRDEKKIILCDQKENGVHNIANKDAAEEKESHYIWMEKRFNSDKMWTWIVNLLAYAAMITFYFMIDGHEIIYAMYLPLDMGLNVCKAGYFFI